MKRSALVVVFVLVASACSSASEGGTSIAPSAEATTTTVAGAADPPVADSASCVGVWELDGEAFFATYNEAAWTWTEDQPSFVDGVLVVTWNADGTFTDEYVDWTFEFPGTDDVDAVIMNGVGAGEWQLVDDETVVTAYEITDSRISMIIDGEEFERPVAPGQPWVHLPDQATVVCTDTVMTTSGGGWVSTFVRTG